MRAVQNILPWSSTTQKFPNFHHDIVSIIENIVYIYIYVMGPVFDSCAPTANISDATPLLITYSYQHTK